MNANQALAMVESGFAGCYNDEAQRCAEALADTLKETMVAVRYLIERADAETIGALPTSVQVRLEAEQRRDKAIERACILLEAEATALGSRSAEREEALAILRGAEA